jgi:hypothetical protein
MKERNEAVKAKIVINENIINENVISAIIMSISISIIMK